MIDLDKLMDDLGASKSTHEFIARLKRIRDNNGAPPERMIRQKAVDGSEVFSDTYIHNGCEEVAQ